MTVILSNISALEFWRSPLSDSSRARKPSRARIMPEDAPHATAIEEYGLIGNEVFSLPLHVMALDGRRKSTHDLVVHQSRFLPAGSLRSISIPGCDKAVFVTSPELTLVHMASLLSFPQTVHLGYEFCGTYAPDKSRPYGIRGRIPLATPSSIKACLLELENVRGTKTVRKALPRILEQSASPRESTLAALVTLPCMRGGSGIAHPLMNAIVPIGKRNRWTADKSFFRCDLLWPDQGVAVEYDSTLCHTGAERIAQDAQRRNALESLGITVVTATWQQVANYREYNRFVRILARHLNSRIRPSCSDYPRRQLALRSELLDCPPFFG